MSPEQAVQNSLIFLAELDEVRSIMARNADDPAEQPAPHEPVAGLS